MSGCKRPRCRSKQRSSKRCRARRHQDLQDKEYQRRLTRRSLIDRENIPTVSLYYDQGDGTRYRSLGCAPCTQAVKSTAKTPREIVEELRGGQFSHIAERSGRAQDKEDGGGLETLRKEGYM